MKQAKALSFEQALDLLPEEFYPYARINSRSQQIETPYGIMTFHQSSTLRDGGWRTSHREEELIDEVSYVLFALGYEGIIILPSSLILNFEGKYESRYNHNGIPIHIYKEYSDGKTEYYLRGKDGIRFNVTAHFIPNKTIQSEIYQEEEIDYEVYVIKDPTLIGFIEDNNIDGFGTYLEEEETYTFDEPIQFNTEKEALAFCSGLGYGVDERMPTVKLPLRSFEDYDQPFIQEIKKYL